MSSVDPCGPKKRKLQMIRQVENMNPDEAAIYDLLSKHNANGFEISRNTIREYTNQIVEEIKNDMPDQESIRFSKLSMLTIHHAVENFLEDIFSIIHNEINKNDMIQNKNLIIPPECVQIVHNSMIEQNKIPMDFRAEFQEDRVQEQKEIEKEQMKLEKFKERERQKSLQKKSKKKEVFFPILLLLHFVNKRNMVSLFHNYSFVIHFF